MSLIGLQQKQIVAEISAVVKHGKGSLTARKVIFAARTRSKNAIIKLGFSSQQATEAVKDAADIAALELEAL